MGKKYISAVVEKSEDGKITFVASDETLDRAGDVVSIEAWDLKNFKRHPVLLVDHDYKVEKIVGAAKRIWIEDNKLLMRPEFHELTELSKDVKRMVEDGVLKSVSVGYIEHGPEKDGDMGRNELLEVSFVAVGANPNALRLNALAKGVNNEKNPEIEKWVKTVDSEDKGKQGDGATTDIQSVVCSKSRFNSKEEAKRWVTDHDFRADKIDETDDSYRFRQFSPSKCQKDSFRTIELTKGVVGIICRPKKSVKEIILNRDTEQIELIFENSREMFEADSEFIKSMADMYSNLIIEKEGRVLSGRNREKINDAVSVLENAAAALKALLEATNAGKGSEDKKSRTKGGSRGEAKLPSPVLRALQSINKISNHTLRFNKKN